VKDLMTDLKTDKTGPNPLAPRHMTVREACPDERALREKQHGSAYGTNPHENDKLDNINHVLRGEILKSVSMVDQDKACRLLGLSSEDDFASLARLENQGKILRVEYEGRAAYPLFQFDVASKQVYPVIITLMEMRSDAWGSNFHLLHWLTLPHRSFNDARPCDRLPHDADDIVASFDAEISEPLHG